jgi:hypothetical protein
MAVTTAEQSKQRSWLDRSATRTASDAALGCILIIAGALPIWSAGGLSFGRWPRLEATLFPSAIGVGMLAVGLLLLSRAVFVSRPPPPPGGYEILASLPAPLSRF